jgi:glutamine---fructose-6-phosphate transaminase (isomerizing)
VTGALPLPQSTQPSLMAHEAAEAPDVVARLVERNADACRALGARLRSAPPRFVVTCARGCSDSAATDAKYLIELSLGTVVASVGPSISSVYRVKLHTRDVLHAALATDWRQAAGLLASARDLYVIGSGVGYAAAQEVALKFKETCGLHAEAISAAELMHGPLALAGTDFPVLILGQDDEALVSLKAMAAELVAQGATVIAAGPGVGWAGSPLPVVGGLHPLVQPIANVQSFYALAEAISRARGYDPDRPSHLRKVTETV